LKVPRWWWARPGCWRPSPPLVPPSAEMHNSAAMDLAQTTAVCLAARERGLDVTAGKQLISSGMMQEVDRCRAAIEQAMAGAMVALVSSGDPGVYGMAGLAIELAAEMAPDLAMEIVPGVSAANAAAARLGAPLMLDYAVISLSDLLVPDREEIRWAADHASAATMACRPGARVLLTIGSKHIGPYVRAAQENQSDLFARVLPEPDSLEACRRGGLSREQVIAAIGPFCLEENLNLLRRLEIDVLVTKESGVAGGLPEKIEAALERNCRIVIIQRPVEAGADECRSFVEIVQAVSGSDESVQQDIFNIPSRIDDR